MPESDLTELVRVVTESGAETYCSRGHAEVSGLTIVPEPVEPNSSYEAMKVEDLKVQIEIRNHRGESLPTSGKKADLIAALHAADAAARGVIAETAPDGSEVIEPGESSEPATSE